MMLETEVFYDILEEGKIIFYNKMVLCKTSLVWTIIGRHVHKFVTLFQCFATFEDTRLKRFREIESILTEIK